MTKVSIKQNSTRLLLTSLLMSLFVLTGCGSTSATSSSSATKNKVKSTSSQQQSVKPDPRFDKKHKQHKLVEMVRITKYLADYRRVCSTPHMDLLANMGDISDKIEQGITEKEINSIFSQWQNKTTERNNQLQERQPDIKFKTSPEELKAELWGVAQMCNQQLQKFSVELNRRLNMQLAGNEIEPNLELMNYLSTIYTLFANSYKIEVKEFSGDLFSQKNTNIYLFTYFRIASLYTTLALKPELVPAEIKQLDNLMVMLTSLLPKVKDDFRALNGLVVLAKLQKKNMQKEPDGVDIDSLETQTISVVEDMHRKLEAQIAKAKKADFDVMTLLPGQMELAIYLARKEAKMNKQKAQYFKQAMVIATDIANNKK